MNCDRFPVSSIELTAVSFDYLTIQILLLQYFFNDFTSLPTINLHSVYKCIYTSEETKYENSKIIIRGN